MVLSGTLSLSSQPCGNRGSLQGAETLPSFRPMPLLLSSPTPVNRDPSLGTRKEVRMEVRVVRSHAVTGYLSIPLHLLRHGTGDSNLVGYLRFEFYDPCVVLSQVPARTGNEPIPVVPALLCSFSRLCIGAEASADSEGHGAEKTGRKVAPKGMGKTLGRAV